MCKYIKCKQVDKGLKHKKDPQNNEKLRERETIEAEI